ncbi:MAG: hypothetical protein JNJ73_05865 [Hyphomonadaceae bacterium]|nr:hypothetical protein [Hyphomonadaceae bacterium]
MKPLRDVRIRSPRLTQMLAAWRAAAQACAMPKVRSPMRLDQALVARGLAASRAKAQAAIAAGGVRVDGVVVEKAAVLVEAGARSD